MCRYRTLTLSKLGFGMSNWPQSLSTSKRSELVSWCKPPFGWSKINTDGVRRLNGGCSVAPGRRCNPRLQWRVEARVLLEPDNKEAQLTLAVLCNQTPKEKVGEILYRISIVKVTELQIAL
ncbi:hypothetical protein V6N12_016454 [Hibiscus sabdariffa]|uniref:Uncharacterized protein n=1 Tax=Hibiscus sabdariffa TaxID=183260 RepID=A0ABR2CDN1_9ROSI